MKNIFLLFVVCEVAVIGIVTGIFRLIENRLVAGAVAGTVFVALGLLIVVSGLRRKEVRRSLSMVLGCVHLFGVALPMMIVRLMNSSAAFSDVRIWGMPGPDFHRLSSFVYMALLLASIIDWLRLARRHRRIAQ